MLSSVVVWRNVKGVCVLHLFTHYKYKTTNINKVRIKGQQSGFVFRPINVS